jgi:hypothetical protein
MRPSPFAASAPLSTGHAIIHFRSGLSGGPAPGRLVAAPGGETGRLRIAGDKVSGAHQITANVNLAQGYQYHHPGPTTAPAYQN